MPQRRLRLSYKNSTVQKTLWGLGALLLILGPSLGCSKKASTVTELPSFPPTKPGPPELPYCSSPTTYSNSVTISGAAAYQYREPFSNGAALTDKGLGAVKGLNASMGDPPKPVRYAEVRVLNSGGGVAQCATTDASGAFSFTLPSGGGTYTIQVNSRANNAQLVATVFDSPDSKTFYTIQTTVSATGSQNVGTLVATATGDLKAGAFNILDQLYLANVYLRAQVGACSLAGCPNFTVSPKIEVFWRKGFNPGSYYNAGPLSFYLPGYGRLFILGGVNGDTDSSDTDHFDNSVILHEFGHFLEDRMLASDSPGGTHSGTSTIDPRLAWSEGWGNFLQAAVQNSPLYFDTIGNVNGTTRAAFYVNLETASQDISQSGPGGIDGEGNYREFSVTRLLWDAVDTNNDGEAITGGFEQMWAALNKNSDGWLSSLARFRSISLFHYVQSRLTGAQDWTTLRSAEKQVRNREPSAYPDPTPTIIRFADYVTAQSGCTGYNYSMSPVNDSTRDMYRNNSFFHYSTATALANVRFRLQYVDSTFLVDLDFYIYNDDPRIGNSSDLLGASQNDASGLGNVKFENITITDMPAGHYLFNVNAYSPTTGSSATYKLQISTNNGSSWTNLCVSEMPL